MSWASARKTTRVEDIACSLLGLFDVNMPLLYGEGKKAFERLQHKIIETNRDESIFAWGDRRRWSPFRNHNDLMSSEMGMFASNIADFSDSGDIVPTELPSIRQTPHLVTNLRLSIQLRSMKNDSAQYPLGGGYKESGRGLWIVLLACARKAALENPIILTLEDVGTRCTRVNLGPIMSLPTHFPQSFFELRHFYIQ